MPLSPQATKEKVLAAATALFAERGIAAVGVDEIAARAEASKLSIYRYFRSKDGLVEAMLRRRSSQTQQRLRAELDKVPAGIDRVLEVFDRVAELYAEDHYRGCPVINTAVEDRAGSDVVRDLARAHLAGYRELFAELLEDAGFTAAHSLARQLLLLIEGANVVSAIDGHAQGASDARVAAQSLLHTATKTGRRG